MHPIKTYFASSNPHPPHSRAYDRYNKLLRILETSTPNSHRPIWTLSKTRLAGYWRDPLANTGEPLRLDTGRILGAGSTGEPLWRDTRQDPLASRSGGILGGIYWRAALAGYSAGSTGEQLWRDTRRDPLASRSGGILGRIHWRAALAGYSAGSTGEQLWRDTRRDPLASGSGGILGGGVV